MLALTRFAIEVFVRKFDTWIQSFKFNCDPIRGVLNDCEFIDSPSFKTCQLIGNILTRLLMDPQTMFKEIQMKLVVSIVLSSLLIAGTAMAQSNSRAPGALSGSGSRAIPDSGIIQSAPVPSSPIQNVPSAIETAPIQAAPSPAPMIDGGVSGSACCGGAGASMNFSDASSFGAVGGGCSCGGSHGGFVDSGASFGGSCGGSCGESFAGGFDSGSFGGGGGGCGCGSSDWGRSYTTSEASGLWSGYCSVGSGGGFGGGGCGGGCGSSGGFWNRSHRPFSFGRRAGGLLGGCGCGF